MRFLRCLSDVLTSVGENLAKLSFLFMVALVTFDVLTRYLFNRSTMMADEVGGYLLVAITFFGAAFTLRQNMQIKVTVVTERFSSRLRNGIALVADIIGLVFVLMVVWLSSKLVWESFVTSSKSNTYMETPMFIPGLVVPIGMGILSMAILYQIACQCKDFFEAPKRN